MMMKLASMILEILLTRCTWYWSVFYTHMKMTARAISYVWSSDVTRGIRVASRMMLVIMVL